MPPLAWLFPKSVRWRFDWVNFELKLKRFVVR